MYSNNDPVHENVGALIRISDKLMRDQEKFCQRESISDNVFFSF